MRGKWVRVPAAHINGQPIVARGKLIRIASLQEEDWNATGIINPADCIRTLKDGCAELPTSIRGALF
jgi:hypothetical protein